MSNLSVVWKHIRTELKDYIDDVDMEPIKTILSFMGNTDESNINRKLLVDDKLSVLSGYLESKYRERSKRAAKGVENYYLSKKKELKSDVGPHGKRLTDWEVQVVIDLDRKYKALTNRASKLEEVHTIMTTLSFASIRRHRSLEQISNNDRVILRKETD